ncbi:MAG: bifunctional oligoribonuclease/PAP phosphatase NrnA [Candidatus Peregrinibacteria bacterium]|nr:bifunctional oligoribonuclease/PAP phosphatase NrnA [Candidatus Peregrinibacteria bacterium]
MQNTNQKNIIELIKRSNKILVLPSSPPDGDSLGSAVALYMSLRKLGKEVTVICADPVPDVYDFLPNMKIVGNKFMSSNDFIITIDCKKIKVDKIKSSIEDDKVNIILSPLDGHFSEADITFNKGEMSYDLIITVDTAELQQLRGIYENNTEIFHQVPVINIDHHISNTHFGKINHVDIMSSSTTELLCPLLEEMAKDTGVDLIDEDIATLLLTGIITDTGSFQNANTTPKSFEVASELIAYGARQQEIIQYIYKTKQLSQLKLWGRVLSKIQTDEKHHIVWSVVSQQDLRDTGSSVDETGDIIDELMTNAPGAEVILLIKEKKDNFISVSIRTTSASIDAAAIAEKFGGGGHTQAAGFGMNDISLRDAEYKVVNAVKEFQAQRKSPAEFESRIVLAPEIQAPEIQAPVAKVESALPEIETKKKVIKRTKAEEDNFKFHSLHSELKGDELGDAGIAYKFED